MIQYFEIPSIDASIRKSLIDGIINKILQESGVGEAEIVYSGEDTDTRQQPEDILGYKKAVTYGANNKCYIEYTETRSEMNRINRGIGTEREVPVFHDKECTIKLSPIMTAYDIELTITRNSSSKDVLQQWVNRLESLMDMGRMSSVFSSESYYYIPMPALELLHDCYVAINARGAKYNTFRSYLATWLNPSTTTVQTITGTNPRLAGRYNATRIEVVYDTSSPTRSREEYNHQAQLTVSFSHTRPSELLCNFPTVLRQTHIKEKWRPTGEPTWVSNDEGVEMSALRRGEDHLSGAQFIRLPYRITDTENSRQVNIPNASAKVAILCTDVLFDESSAPSSPPTDPRDPPEPRVMAEPELLTVGLMSRSRAVFNTTEPVLPTTPPVTPPAFILSRADAPYVWSDAIKAYIDECISMDPTASNSIIKFVLYKNQYPIPATELKWNEYEELEYHNVVDVDSGYYLTEELTIDWGTMLYDDILILRRHPDAVDELIDAVYPEIEKPERLPSGKLAWPAFDTVVSGFGPVKASARFTGHGMGLTVLNTTILTITAEQR